MNGQQKQAHGRKTQRPSGREGEDTPDGGASDDFASAAMLRLIRLGLQRQGLPLPPLPAAAPKSAAGAHVRLHDKRALLLALLERHGPAAIFRLGEAVQDAPDEPALTALLQAHDPPDLVARWQRLERYIHGRHRVKVLAATPGRLRLAHVSLRAGHPPHPAEDLLVWGLLAGLLRRMGTESLTAEPGPDTAVLELRWQPTAARASVSAPTAPDTLAAARLRLSEDCSAPWSLARLATSLGLAPRTLQRRLAEQGSSFSTLWTEVRLAQSARLLAASRESAAQIGYRCGFADQAHFTRSFQRHMAMTPGRFRGEFG